MKTPDNPIILIFVLLVAIMLTALTSYFLFRSVTIKYFSNTAEGEITNYYTKKKDARFQKDRTQVYAPAFSFIDAKNEKIIVRTRVFRDAMKYKKGDVVTVYYNPNNPTKAYLNDSFPWTRDLTMLFFGVMGLIYTVPPLLKYLK